MRRQNFLKIVGVSLAALALPKVALAKPEPIEYTPITHWQFRHLQYGARFWAAEEGKDWFRVCKNRDGLRGHGTLRKTVLAECLPGYKVINAYYRGVTLEHPNGRFTGNHIFIVHENFKMPPPYNPRFEYMRYMRDLEYDIRVRPLGKYLKYDPTTTITFKSP